MAAEAAVAVRRIVVLRLTPSSRDDVRCCIVNSVAMPQPGTQRHHGTKQNKTSPTHPPAAPPAARARPMRQSLSSSNSIMSLSLKQLLQRWRGIAAGFSARTVPNLQYVIDVNPQHNNPHVHAAPGRGSGGRCPAAGHPEPAVVKIQHENQMLHCLCHSATGTQQ